MADAGAHMAGAGGAGAGAEQPQPDMVADMNDAELTYNCGGV